MKNYFLLLLLVLIFGCNDPVNDCGEIAVSYDGIVQTIISESCTTGGCHPGPNGGWPVLPDFTTYENVLVYLEEGSFRERINSPDSTLSMPPLFQEDRVISAEDLEILNVWICNGFPEN